MTVAYSARGASGFGAAAALPLLGLVLPLKVLVPAWTLIGAAAGTALMGSDRHRIAWGEVLKLVPGTLVGIAIGLYFFTLLSADALAKWIGAFVLAYTASTRSGPRSRDDRTCTCRRASRPWSAASPAA
jgi:hypothetical protein